MNYYIASCVFTVRFPDLSRKIRDYVSTLPGMNIIRCCTPGWKIGLYEEKMPEGILRDSWKAIPHTADFRPGDETWSLCANCSNIIEESRPGTRVHSLWELIDSDENFSFPDYSGMKVTLQDCWRSRDRSETHDAVRSLLGKMNIEFDEIGKNRENADFCGTSLYRPQVDRNPKLAPKHYRYGAEGLFLPHTEDEQKELMLRHCAQYKTKTVVCYCHYCLDGLLTAGVDGRHLAALLFPEN